MTSLKIIETKKGKRIKHLKGKIILEKNKKQIKTRSSKSHRLEEALKEEKAKAKDLHPKLLAGMFFFFVLGATGGITSLLTCDKTYPREVPSS